jgi:iron complex transport system substrate-binding protein
MSASTGLWARRTAIAGLGAGAFAALTPIRAAPRPRVVVLDWGLAATVLSLGVTPVGVPQTKLYRRWLKTPELPGSVTDVGLRLQPNLEVLWRLRPDIIVVIDQHEAIRERLERIAPTLALPVYTPSTQPLHRARVVTRRLGEVLDRPARATALIDRAEWVFAQTRSDLSGVDVPPLYLADVLDARHIRLFGRRSLFGNVLDDLALANAWQGSTSYWGSVTVGPAKLAAVPEAGWVRVTSLDPAVRQKLGDSRLWQSLPFVQAGRMAALEPVLPFGALPSAMHFAAQIGSRLPEMLGAGSQ